MLPHARGSAEVPFPIAALRETLQVFDSWRYGVGQADACRWDLRVTEVFERRDADWVRLHRHADPMVDRHPLDQGLNFEASCDRWCYSWTFLRSEWRSGLSRC